MLGQRGEAFPRNLAEPRMMFPAWRPNARPVFRQMAVLRRAFRRLRARVPDTKTLWTIASSQRRRSRPSYG